MKYDAVIKALAGTMHEAHALPQGDADERRIRRTVIRNVERAAASVLNAQDAQVSGTLVGGLTEVERNEIRLGRIISAIKMLRERTGIGLKEAKDIVCAYRDRYFPYRGEVPT